MSLGRCSGLELVVDKFEEETLQLAQTVEQHAAKATHDEVKRMLNDAAESIKKAAKYLRTH